MTEKDISRALRADRPRRPDVRDWAGKSRRKARNRRLAVVAAALVAAAGITVPLAVQNLVDPPLWSWPPRALTPPW